MPPTGYPTFYCPFGALEYGSHRFIANLFRYQNHPHLCHYHIVVTANILALRDFGALSRSLFISEADHFASDCNTGCTDVAIQSPQKWQISLHELEDQIGSNPNPFKAYHVGIHGWEKTTLSIIHHSQVEEFLFF